MYHTEPSTDKTIREWYMNSSRVAACALRNEQVVRAHRPGRAVRFALHPAKRPSTHCTGGWVGPRTGLEGRKISPQRDSILGPSSP